MPAEPSSTAFLEFVRSQAAKLREGDAPPQSKEEWEKRREQLRSRLAEAFGPFPEKPCDLATKSFGELKRDDYRVEKIAFQTRPEVWMTANAYVPEKPCKLPAVLCVHGHWKGAKQDPAVQARCIGLAKLGFFVLVVDAFGAGERAIGVKLGEYHGEMTAGTLWPTGLSLAGCQVYENMRAVDYLLTRPEVDGTRIGITGASGGGNQSMYAGAWDERLKAVVPVCSVGNYQAYLGAACCMCEVVPGALMFTEEGGILGLVAPRALLVMNATKDGRQFSVAEAKKSLDYARPIFSLRGAEKNLRHDVFESPHDYSKGMREAMYGWMTLHLKGEGDGAPIVEAEFKAEDPEELRCFPGDSRPAEYITLPRFAAAEAKKLLAARPQPDHLEFWESEAYTMREGLNRVLGPDPDESSLKLTVTDLPDNMGRLLEFDAEAGMRIAAKHLLGESKRWVVLVDLEGMEKAAESDIARALLARGWNVVCVDLRACGRTGFTPNVVGRAPDHNSAEWSLWIGRPLVGQWAIDVRRTVDAILASIEGVPDEVGVLGVGPGGLIALVAAATDEDIDRVAAVDSLVTLASDVPYQGQRLGLLAPGMLRHTGDVVHLASLIAPRRVLISGGVDASGKTIDVPQLEEHFAYARRIFNIVRPRDRLTISANGDAKVTAEKFDLL